MKNVALVKRPSKSFIGPMPLVPMPKRVQTIFDEPNKAIVLKPKVVVLKPKTKEELGNEIKELESKLKELKAESIRLYGSTSGYKPPMNVGVGDFIKSKIKEGLRNVDILKLVEEQYKNNNTTYACVAWYRNDMKKKGLI